MTDQLEILEDRVNAIEDATITKGDVSVSWDGLEYTYRAFGREIDRDEALALLRALETEENHGGSRLFRLAASTPKAEGVIYAKREGDRVRWYRHMDIHNRMEFYGRAEASLFTVEEVKHHIKTVQGYMDQGGWISAVWPELAKNHADDLRVIPGIAAQEKAWRERTTPEEIERILADAEQRQAEAMTRTLYADRGKGEIQEFVTDPEQKRAQELAKALYPATAETALHKAAKNYAFRVTPDALEQYALSLAFRAGAEWQAARITDAIEEAIK